MLKNISFNVVTVSASTDGTPSMTETKTGFVSFVKHFSRSLSFPRRISGSKKHSSYSLETQAVVFKDVISVVNYIKFCLMCTRLFRALRDEIGAERSGFMFHSNIPWLSKEEVLERE